MTNPRTATNPTWVGMGALIICALFWSLNGPLIKLLTVQDGGVPAVTIACYRSLIGGLIFTPFALRRLGTLKRAGLSWRVGSVLSFTVMTACFVIATTVTQAANAIILQYTSPLWVFALSPLLLKEKPGWTEGLVLLVAMAGVVVIFSGHEASGTAGLIIALGSGLGYGTLTVMLRGLRAVDPMAVAWMNGLGSGLLLLPGVVIWGSFALTPAQLGLILLLSVVQFSLPYVLFSWALQRVEAHRASLIVLLETVLNPLWTFLLVGELVPPATLMGGPLILAGVVGWLMLSWRGPHTSRGRTE